MKTINRILVQCTSEDDAGRIQAVLEENNFTFNGEELRNLWQVFRTHTVFEIREGIVYHQSDSYYNLKIQKGYYSQWDFVSADEFMHNYDPSYFSFKRLIKALLWGLGIIILASAIICLIQAICAMLPMWVNIFIVVALVTYIMYNVMR